MIVDANEVCIVLTPAAVYLLFTTFCESRIWICLGLLSFSVEILVTVRDLRVTLQIADESIEHLRKVTELSCRYREGDISYTENASDVELKNCH
jgi:hypothetical protein